MMLAQIFIVNKTECHLRNTVNMLGKQMVTVNGVIHNSKCFRAMKSGNDDYFEHSYDPLQSMKDWCKSIGFTNFQIVKPDGQQISGKPKTRL